MTKSVSLSQQEKSIEYIKGWYEDQMEAINDLRLKIVLSLSNPNLLNINSKFYQLDLNEINEYFAKSRKELEHLVCLDLISATEAFLRIDYIKRVKNRDRSNITKTFRNIDNTKGSKVSLENDIIETWKSGRSGKTFSDFLGLLKYRHWLAHGRYWTPKIGRDFSFDVTYKISESIFKTVSK